jgi:hypothetical protein
MKNNITTTDKRFKNKMNLFMLFSMIMISFSQCVSAQGPLKSENIVFTNNTDQIHITSCTMISVQEKNYLKWTVKGEKENTIYVVERSINGNEFESIGIKKGYASPENFQILYCFTDDNPSALTCSYRIKQIHSDGFVQLSNVENTNNPDGQSLFGALKN